MRINQTNPNIQLQNILGLEQAARKEVQEKAAEAAKAHAAEEALRLQQLADSVKKKKPVGKEDSNSPSQQGRRNARYLPDGTVQTEGPEAPGDAPPPSPRAGIDIRA